MAKSKPSETLTIDAVYPDVDVRREHLWCEAVVAAVRRDQPADAAIATADAILAAYDSRRTDRVAFG